MIFPILESLIFTRIFLFLFRLYTNRCIALKLVTMTTGLWKTNFFIWLAYIFMILIPFQLISLLLLIKKRRRKTKDYVCSCSLLMWLRLSTNKDIAILAAPWKLMQGKLGNSVILMPQYVAGTRIVVEFEDEKGYVFQKVVCSGFLFYRRRTAPRSSIARWLFITGTWQEPIWIRCLRERKATPAQVSQMSQSPEYCRITRVISPKEQSVCNVLSFCENAWGCPSQTRLYKRENERPSQAFRWADNRCPCNHWLCKIRKGEDSFPNHRTR